MSPGAIAILRAATRYPNGIRHWIIPGAPNAARLVPSRHSFWQGQSSAFHWPEIAKGDWQLRGVRLDWHRSIAKRHALALIESCK